MCTSQVSTFGYNHVFMLTLTVNNAKSGTESVRLIPELEGSSMSVSSVDFLTSLIALLGLHQHMHIIKQLTDQQIERSINLRYAQHRLLWRNTCCPARMCICNVSAGNYGNAFLQLHQH